ncbi:M23 family metallopeptidase [Nocardioides sp.]|uniref:M23 family metallopeptidase n=1 Tax=Nocardioides sp. TaxID=35761 RepID=UPI002ED337D6
MRPLTLLPTLLVVVLLGHGPAGADEADPVGEWPLRPVPEVVRDFDPPSAPWGAGHRGVDLAGRAGQRVHPALAGVVSFAGTIAGRGVVTVDHGSTRTTYEPVTPSVEVGTTVGPRDTLGRLAYAGSHCPPDACLHWGWLEGDTYLDPLRLVGAGPVRLLPLDGLPTQASSLVRPRLPYRTWQPPHIAAGLGPVLGGLPAGGCQTTSPTASSRSPAVRCSVSASRR